MEYMIDEDGDEREGFVRVITENINFSVDVKALLNDHIQDRLPELEELRKELFE